ncbi:MAG: DMT family transporter [Rikenellaceae bacterium]
MKNITAHIELLTCNLIWACSYPLYNLVMPSHIKPLPLFTATVIVTALMSLTSLLSSKRDHVEKEDMMAIVGAALLIALLRKGMLLFGLSLTSSVDGSIISSLAPVAVLVISVVAGVERFSGRKAMGILLGLGGAIGVVLSGGGNSHSDSGMVGNILILLCAFISAVYMVWFKGLLKKYEPMTLLRWMFCVTAIVMTPFGLDSLMNVDTSKYTIHIWLAIAYLVFMPTYIPNLLLTSALKKVSPTVTSIYYYVQPTVAVAISVCMGLDTLRLTTIIFAALIFSGVGIVISTQR